MTKLVCGAILAAAFGTAIAVASALPVSAQLARPQTPIGVGAGSDLLTKVQDRQYYNGFSGGFYGGYRSYGYSGPAPGAYNGSLADSVASCMRRFRSYDPASRTYLGHDGFRHPCP